MARPRKTIKIKYEFNLDPSKYVFGDIYNILDDKVVDKAYKSLIKSRDLCGWSDKFKCFYFKCSSSEDIFDYIDNKTTITNEHKLLILTTDPKAGKLRNIRRIEFKTNTKVVCDYKDKCCFLYLYNDEGLLIGMFSEDIENSKS